MLTRALAKAWAPKISVNTVAPGVIPFGKNDDRIERLIAATPAQREGTGEEIAEAVLIFLRRQQFHHRADDRGGRRSKPAVGACGAATGPRAWRMSHSMLIRVARLCARADSLLATCAG